MKILLVRPPYTRIRGAGQVPYFPLGIGYVAAMLEQAGFETALYHADVASGREERILHDERDVFTQRSLAQQRYRTALQDDAHPVWREVEETLDRVRPDVVGVSLLSVEFPAALKISRLVKRRNPRTPVVWGGFHPTFMAASCLRHPEVDCIVAGEGERTAVELMRALADGARLDGIAGLYLKAPDGSVAFTGPRPLIESLDDIPPPARHLRLYPERYDPRAMGNLITSRGCPFRCAFCSCRNLWEKKYRRRSPANVVHELRTLTATYRTNHIFFMDDTFSLQKSYGLELCRAIRAAQLNVVWTTDTRVDRVDDELIRAMKQAGCVYLDLGVETGSDRMSALIKKDITREQVLHALALINRHGIATGVFFMAGFLTETLDDLEATFTLIKQCKPTHIALNVWDPMPGSELYEQAVTMGVISPEADWTRFPFWPDAHYAVPIPPETFLKKCNAIAAYVYAYNHSPLTYFRKIWPKIAALLWRDPAYLMFRLSLWARERLLRLCGVAHAPACKNV